MSAIECAGSGLVVAAYLKRSRSVRLGSPMYYFFTPFNYIQSYMSYMLN